MKSVEGGSADPQVRRERGNGFTEGRLFLGGQAVSLLGDSLAVLAVALLVLELSRDPLVSALSAGSVTMGYLVVGLPAGVLVDRWDPWRVLMVTDAARAALFLCLFALCAAGLPSVGGILALAFLAGVCQVFFATALVIVVRDLFSGPGLIRANAGLELAAQLSLVLGPAAVGALVAAGGLETALLVDALTFVVSLASLAAVRHRRPRSEQQGGPVRLRELAGEFGAGLRHLRSTRVLAVMTAVQMAVNLSLAAEKLLFFYARDTLALTPALTSAVVAAGGAGGILAALTADRLATRAGEVRSVAAAIALAGAALAAMSITASFATLALANLAYGWAVVTASLLNRTFRQRLVPRHFLGRLTSTVRMLFLAVQPVGILLTGALAKGLGDDPRPVFLGAGLLTAAAATGGWFAGLSDYHRTTGSGAR